MALERWILHLEEDEDICIFEGYAYIVDNVRHEIRHVRCRYNRRQCFARGIIDRHGNFRYTSLPDPVTGSYHYHLPEPSLQAQYRFARELHRCITHSFVQVREIYNTHRTQHIEAASILTYERMRSSSYRWRNNMSHPMARTYDEVVAVLTRPPWHNLYVHNHAQLRTIKIDSPGGTSGLALLDRAFTREYPVGDLYVGNTTHILPRMQGTSNFIFVLGKNGIHAFPVAWALLNGQDEDLYSRTMHTFKQNMNLRPRRLFCHMQRQLAIQQTWPNTEVHILFDEFLRVRITLTMIQTLIKTASTIEGMSLENERHKIILRKLSVITWLPPTAMAGGLRYILEICPPEYRAFCSDLATRLYAFINQHGAESASFYRKQGVFDDCLMMHYRILKAKNRMQGSPAFWDNFGVLLNLAEVGWQDAARLNEPVPRFVYRTPTIWTCIDLTLINRLWDQCDEELSISRFLEIASTLVTNHMNETLHNRDYDNSTILLTRGDNQNMAFNDDEYHPDPVVFREGFIEEILDDSEDDEDGAMNVQMNDDIIDTESEDEERNDQAGADLLDAVHNRGMNVGVNDVDRQVDLQIAAEDGNGQVVMEDMADDEEEAGIIAVQDIEAPMNEENIPNIDVGNAEVQVNDRRNIQYDARCFNCEVNVAQTISIHCMCLLYCNNCTLEIRARAGRNSIENLNIPCPNCDEPIVNLERIYIPNVDGIEYDWTCLVCFNEVMNIISKPCNQLVMCTTCVTEYQRLGEGRCPACNLRSDLYRINIREM